MSGQVITHSKCIVHCSTLKVTSYINLLAEPYPLFELDFVVLMNKKSN